MEFDHIGVSRQLMKPVDILGNHRLQFAQFFQFGEPLVTFVGLRPIKDVFHVLDQKIPDFYRVPQK